MDDPASLGFEEATGYLAAIDEANGAVRWVIRVYENSMIPGIEADVQEIYFASMELLGSELRITNERGDRYVVDVNTQRVTQVK